MLMTSDLLEPIDEIDMNYIESSRALVLGMVSLERGSIQVKLKYKLKM